MLFRSLPISRCGSALLFLPNSRCGSPPAFYTDKFSVRQRPIFYTARFSLRQHPRFLYCPFLVAAAPRFLYCPFLIAAAPELFILTNSRCGSTPAFYTAHFSLRQRPGDRKSTRLNSSHQIISYAVFCLKKKNTRLNSSHVKIFRMPSFF